MTFESALKLAASRPGDQASLEALAKRASNEGEEDRALPLLKRGLKQNPTARLWQWKGLLERSIDNYQQALQSFAEAAELDPADTSIAHGHARVAMEAGLDARPFYQRARLLAPQDGQILIGMAAALAAMGQGEQAVVELQSALERTPLWLAGHEQLAQILATLGRGEQATFSLELALRQLPRAPRLWVALLNIHLRRGTYQALNDIVDRAETAGVHLPEFAIYRGVYAAEFDQETFPELLFGQFAPAIDAELGRWRVRHLLRVGAVKDAVSLIDGLLDRDQSGELWAYAGTAWRLSADPRLEWLEGDARLISVFDLRDRLPPLFDLADTLRSLHVAKGEYLDQSVRGGTQTDGPLLSRVDPLIQQLRATIVEAVEQHIAQLPPIDPRHPALRYRRDRRVRFSGSWSVRLRSGGRHSNHIHPLGWISSALYIGLPLRKAGERQDAGWFTIGQPDSLLGIELAPWKRVEPKLGRLVLFPSSMWHGTVPFAEGERLTVAFDVASPRPA